MSIADNLNSIKDSLPEEVTLVAVSKTKPVSAIQEAYDSGHRIFGENKVQELADKYNELPKDIQWHMIGHLQRNKVKYMAHFVHLIHGVDSLKLLKEINKQALKHNRVINCLFQLKIADEESKFGMNTNDLEEILGNSEFKNLHNINIVGLMGMATFTNNTDQLKSEFDYLKNIFDQYQNYSTLNFKLETISMGMSGDYDIAIECGSTMIRVGSKIFGVRNYN
ncbi:MAG: YggS family pyridoxal phosphate-dependent enzyme [bacterium]